ncbi:hypothetical protein [Niveispirillum sp. KHB5.9]|uniref:hypothetical protein n=1 Tax=Niveispirillum sp. KHB5.9 TaxID=3400269 RepID=UPI003A882BD0
MKTGLGWMMVAALALLPGCLVVDSMRFQQARDAAMAVPAGPLPLELPMQDMDGLITFPAKVNGKADLLFALDTGAPVSVLLAGAETAPLGLDLSDAQKLGDSPASPIGSFRFGFTVDMGPVALRDLPMIAVPIDTMPCRDRLDKMGVRGIVGADLLRHYVVEADFDADRLRLHDPKGWAPPSGATILPLEFKDGHIYVQAGVTLPDGRQADGLFHVDSGKNTALLLRVGTDPAFLMPPAGGKTRHACYINGLEEQREGDAVVLRAAGAAMPAVPSLYSPPGSLKMGGSIGTIGAGALRRWNVTFDYPGKRLILLPRAGGVTAPS